MRNSTGSIFGLQIGTFQDRLFPDRWSRGTKILGSMMEKYVYMITTEHAPFAVISDLFMHPVARKQAMRECSC